MKKFILQLILLMVFCNAMTQTVKSKAAFYLTPQLALLNGDNSASGQAQLTGGLEKNNWCFGAGIAIDYYKVRTVPLFADIRFFFGKNRSIFAYGNLGYNLAWALESQYRNTWTWINGVQKSHFSNGLYSDIGLSYAVTGQMNKGVIMSIGYSMKTITETYGQAQFRDVPPYDNNNVEYKLNYTLNRIAVKLGFGF